MKTQSVKYPETKPSVLLTSVFGPYAQDDEYGSRKNNPAELFHNQVTREQGVFSFRLFHPSYGLLLLKENINAPCTLLDFPDLDRFIDEIRGKSYDVIGISSIIPNVGKVRKMCEIIREYQPGATIVVGGHVTNLPDIGDRIDADHIVRGDGVRWFREFFGENVDAPVRHPCHVSAFGARVLGITLRDKPGDTGAILIPSVGCPMGCNFCATSHMFGGKGKFVNFYETGDELFAIMCGIEKQLHVRSFHVMDENFLLQKPRALRLLELMKLHNKSWSLNVFSSARVIQSYTEEQLVRLGVCWIWMGMEGKESHYSKLDGIDTHALVARLQKLGIRVLGSSIIGLEDHTPETVDAAIEWAVSHNTVFHQFMLYTPIPGTPLYEVHRKNGSLLTEEECPIPDTHGQHRFNFRHPHIKNGAETELLRRAFRRDFEINGPSIMRLSRTMLAGWKTLKNHPDPCVRDRARWEYGPIQSTYAGSVWAMKHWYRRDAHILNQVNGLLKDLYEEFGWKTRILSWLYGAYIYLRVKAEDRRLAKGWTYEPAVQYIKNELARVLETTRKKVTASLPPRRTVKPGTSFTIPTIPGMPLSKS